MAVYKTNMASALEHMAATKNIPTSFEHLTLTVRAQWAAVTHKARAKQMRGIHDENNDGLPDKCFNFQITNINALQTLGLLTMIMHGVLDKD